MQVTNIRYSEVKIRMARFNAVAVIKARCVVCLHIDLSTFFNAKMAFDI
jgi:hypothetical protein